MLLKVSFNRHLLKNLSASVSDFLTVLFHWNVTITQVGSLCRHCCTPSSQHSACTINPSSQAGLLDHQLPAGPPEAQRGLRVLPSAATATITAQPPWHRSFHPDPPESPSSHSAREVL
ncbi:unnamed protein product [Nyctereutes procyonoides]|uniref:(raccoon dog) hypothetical protein n=1 Tax=Nyctereutes procyonoides TaxID=34880 RepID=A0A811Y0W3_NYCPR|nr:unnamed protein product [Nyctereutes procyonoides]